MIHVADFYSEHSCYLSLRIISSDTEKINWFDVVSVPNYLHSALMKISDVRFTGLMTRRIF
jgi:hypothetical protein